MGQKVNPNGFRIGFTHTWPSVWFKGGSESGVLTLGWLSTNRHGETFVVEAMVANPDAQLAADSLTKLPALAKQAFEPASCTPTCRR